MFEWRDIAKNIAHCPDTFSLWTIMYITKLIMTSTTCSSDDDPIKTTDLRVPKINAYSWRSLANLDLSARRSVKILTKCILLKSHEPVHAMRIKSGIALPEASIRACALKLGFVRYKYSRVV